MRDRDIKIDETYEVSMGRGKSIVTVTGIAESGSWLCTTTNGTAIKIGDPSRFLKRVKPTPGKGKKAAPKNKPDKAPVAPAKAKKGKAVPPSDPKAERPQKAVKTSVIVDTTPADAETIELLHAEYRDAAEKARVAQKALTLGLVDQSQANDAHFKAEAAKLSLLKAGGKTHKGGRCTSQMSALSAAHRILSESGRPMRAGEITDEANHKGYWKSDASTPESTLSSAIRTDIQRKGAQSRFVKVGTGLFTVKD